MALSLYPLNGHSVRLGVEQKEEEGLQDASNVMSLKDLIEPSPTDRAGTWIPITQAVKHDEKRPGGQSVKR